MDKERLQFKIGISGTYWDKKPQYVISIDDIEYANSTIASPSEQTELIEFTAELSNLSEHVLNIRLVNKESTDTIQNDEKTAIINDMLLNIVSIEVDDISLETLLWDKSTFVLDQEIEYQGKTINSLTRCVNLGMNGSYQIPFKCPFYIWLLENL